MNISVALHFRILIVMFLKAAPLKTNLKEAECKLKTRIELN